MIDVIVPLHYKNATQAMFGSLTSLADATDVPLRFIIAGRGGSRDDWDIIRDWLDSLRDEAGLHYGLLAHDSSVGNEMSAVLGVLDLIKHDHVLIMGSHVLISDERWFVKLRDPLNTAPYVGGVFMLPKPIGSSTLEPNPLTEPTKVYPSSAVLTTRAHIEMCRPFPLGDSFLEMFQRQLVASGSMRWSHPGIAFEVRDEQATWPQR